PLKYYFYYFPVGVHLQSQHMLRLPVCILILKRECQSAFLKHDMVLSYRRSSRDLFPESQPLFRKMIACLPLCEIHPIYFDIFSINKMGRMSLQFPPPGGKLFDGIQWHLRQ
ncbi:unnamed protein product, partial [Owenia fusiformis]